MITLEVLKKAFGEDEGAKLLKYLQNKNKGGRNNAKGNSFENFYSVYQIARYFNDNLDHDKILFSSQTYTFVDDLLIEKIADKNETYFQIKDVVNLNWLEGEHPLKNDFIYQYKISTNSGVNVKFKMVVSDKSVYENLRSKLPIEIKDFVEVVHFETASSLNNLIRKNLLMKEELTKMCALYNPSTDKLETLATILLGAWDASDKSQIQLKEILNKSHTQNPNYIKGHSNKLSHKLSNILNSISGFSYEVENGFLKWKFNKTDEGVLEHRIGSMEFEQWENDIFNKEIKTFEDLESSLSS
jgi:hypothetical protein